MKYHPEQEIDEIYLGNTWPDEIPRYLSALKTIRIGRQPYDIDGNELALTVRARPLFVGCDEYDAYNWIMEARLSAIRNGK